MFGISQPSHVSNRITFLFQESYPVEHATQDRMKHFIHKRSSIDLRFFSWVFFHLEGSITSNVCFVISTDLRAFTLLWFHVFFQSHAFFKFFSLKIPLRGIPSSLLNIIPPSITSLNNASILITCSIPFIFFQLQLQTWSSILTLS